MVISPPHKKSKFDANSATETMSANNNNNSNQGTKFKFTATTNSTGPKFSNTNNNPNQQQTTGYNKNQQQPVYNQQHQQQNRYQQQQQQNHYQPPQPPKQAPIESANDEDMFDISDSELIKASQQVESQIKFTNNVHHTTSNAVNIFSQFNNANDGYGYGYGAGCGGGGGLMGPPLSTTIYSNSQYNNNANTNKTTDPYVQLDEMKSELKQMKSENMQKDGEVKILRDKLKRLEQETQKMRTERVDLVKKLQQQQDDAKKSLQKQIEYKELENQFKSQEIVELTMKYKVLESTVKKNATAAANSGPLSSSSSSVASSMSNMAQQLITKPKNTPTKRAGSAQTLTNNGSSSLSDTENDNPFLEVKRPMLAPTAAAAAATMVDSKANSPVLQQQQQRPMLTNKSNNQQVTRTPSAARVESPLLLNSSSSFTPKQTASLGSSASSSAVKQAAWMSVTKPLPPEVVYRRRCVLNTKFTPQRQAPLTSNVNKIYEITDVFAETAIYLSKFNLLNSSEAASRRLVTGGAMTTTTSPALTLKLVELNEFIRVNSNINSDVSSSQSRIQSLEHIERIEFVSQRLNEELVKIVNTCLRQTTCQTSGQAVDTKPIGDEQFHFCHYLGLP
jgi:hypothetical protein